MIARSAPFLFFLTFLVLSFSLPVEAQTDSTSQSSQETDWTDPEVQAFLQQEGVGQTKQGLRGAETTFGLFGDVTYASKRGDVDKFSVGQLVLHGTADFGQGFGSLIEVTLNSDPEWEARVERLQMFWEHDDYLKFSFGRFHLPVTWWNSTFHHGLWLQTTVRRPIMLGFDTAFIANHAIGLTAEGFIPGLEDYGLRYMVGVSGGDDDSHHIHDDGLVSDGHHDMNDMHGDEAGALDQKLQSGPENHQIMPLAGIFYQPSSLPRLQMGVVAYTERYTWNDHHEVDYLALGAHIAYTSEQPEFILEYVDTVHDIEGFDQDYRTWSAYGQFAWRLCTSGIKSKFKPYARVERIDIEDKHPMFADKATTDRYLGGLRIDLNPNLAIKLEYVHTDPEDMPTSRETLVQAVMTW